MRCSCGRSELARALAIVHRAVANRPVLPILTNVRLTTELPGQLTLATTNLERGITCQIEALVQEEEAITVPANVFTELVTSLPDDRLELVTAEKRGKMPVLQIRGLHSCSTLRGIDAVEFPHIPTLAEVEQEASITLSASLLKELVEDVAFAASTDITRPAFTGILMQVEPQAPCLTLVAADSLRLVVREEQLSDPVAGDWSDVLIPARTLMDLSRILPTEGTVRIVATPRRNQVLFHAERIELVSRLIEADFPAYRTILPAHAVTRAVVETRALDAAIRSAAPFAREHANMIRLTINPSDREHAQSGTLEVEATSDLLGTTISTVQATITGPGQTILLNVRYLTEALPKIHATTLALEVQAPDRPIVVRPQGYEARLVLMPLSLKQQETR